MAEKMWCARNSAGSRNQNGEKQMNDKKGAPGTKRSSRAVGADKGTVGSREKDDAEYRRGQEHGQSW
jgi:hypothetical protein